MPQPLEFGKHRLRVTGSAVVEPQGKEPVIHVYVQDVEDPDQLGTVYLSTSDSAFEWTEKKLGILGWNMKENDYRIDYLNVEEGQESPIQGVEFDADVVEGKPWVGQDGKERPGSPQVNFLALGGFAERMSNERAIAFSKKLRARVLASKGPGSAASSPAKQKPPVKRTPAPPAGKSMASPWDEDEASAGT